MRKVVAREFQVVLVALDNPGWSFAKKERKQAEQGGLAGRILPCKCSVPTYINLDGFSFGVRINKDESRQEKFRCEAVMAWHGRESNDLFDIHYQFHVFPANWNKSFPSYGSLIDLARLSY